MSLFRKNAVYCCIFGLSFIKLSNDRYFQICFQYFSSSDQTTKIWIIDSSNGFLLMVLSDILMVASLNFLLIINFVEGFD